MNVHRATRALTDLGVVAIVLGLSKVHAAWVANPSYDFTGSFRFAWATAYVVLLCVAAYGVGLPDQMPTWRSAARASAVATGIGVAGVSLAQLALGTALLPRFVVFGSAVPMAGWFFLCAWLAAGERLRAEERTRVLLVSEPGEAEIVAQELAAAPEAHARLVTCLGVAEASGDGRSQPLTEAAAALGAHLVVLDRVAQEDERVLAQAARLHSHGVRVRTLTGFYEEWLGKLPVSELERASLLFDIGELHDTRYSRRKRLLDVAVAVTLLPALAVVVPVVWVANRWANQGSLLFRQVRVGRRGRTFEMLKLRTMQPHIEVSDDPDEAAVWTTTDDPRITPFGGFLRRTHLDELPQVLNILRGDLSVVGPRPEQPAYVAELSAKLPFYDVRHLVRPGLTGWAQVKYGYAGDERDALEKLQYEFWYLRNQRLGLDLRVLGRTVRHVLGGQGR